MTQLLKSELFLYPLLHSIQKLATGILQLAILRYLDLKKVREQGGKTERHSYSLE